MERAEGGSWLEQTYLETVQYFIHQAGAAWLTYALRAKWKLLVEASGEAASVGGRP